MKSMYKKSLVSFAGFVFIFAVGCGSNNNSNETTPNRPGAIAEDLGAKNVTPTPPPGGSGAGIGLTSTAKLPAPNSNTTSFDVACIASNNGVVTNVSDVVNTVMPKEKFSLKFISVSGTTWTLEATVTANNCKITGPLTATLTGPGSFTYAPSTGPYNMIPAGCDSSGQLSSYLRSFTGSQPGSATATNDGDLIVYSAPGALVPYCPAGQQLFVELR